MNTSISVEDETLTLTFGEPIPAGKGVLEFHFTDTQHVIFSNCFYPFSVYIYIDRNQF